MLENTSHVVCYTHEQRIMHNDDYDIMMIVAYLQCSYSDGLKHSYCLGGGAEVPPPTCFWTIPAEFATAKSSLSSWMQQWSPLEGRSSTIYGKESNNISLKKPCLPNNGKQGGWESSSLIYVAL